MTVPKKIFHATAALSVLLCVCTKAPEYCNDRALDTDKEFCFGGVTYAKCGGKEYNPDAEFCYAGKTVYAKCDSREYDPLSQTCNKGVLSGFCGGEDTYSLATQFCYAGAVYARCDTASYNPSTQFCNAQTVYPKCGGKEYNPVNNKCENNVVLTRCGGAFYDSIGQFCANNTIHDKCGGQYVYDPATQKCENGTVKAQCGTEFYNPAVQFCYISDVIKIVDKCGGQYVYDPATQQCENGTVKAPCGTEFYNPALQFCVANTSSIYSKCGGQEYDPIGYKCENDVLLTKCGNEFFNPAVQFCYAGKTYAKCDGKDYDPLGFKCDNNVLKTKCGDNSYFDPATEFCSNGTVRATCGGKEYDPSKQKCDGNKLVDMVVIKVAFDANGAGGTAPQPETVDAGTEVTMPGNGTLSKDGYNFGGWNTNASGTGTNYAAGAKYKAAGTNGQTVTFYARWLRVFTVTFSANGGDGEVPPMTADSGNTITLPSQDPLGRAGHTKGGWNTLADGSGTNYLAGASYRVTGTTTLFAKWTAVTYTLTVNMSPATGGGSVERIPAGNNGGNSYNAGTSVSVTATPMSGYRFSQWAWGTFTSAENPLKITIDENKTVTATFTRAYALTISANHEDGGTVTRVPDLPYYDAADLMTVTVSAAANDDYVFIGWEGSRMTRTPSITLTMNQNYTLKAIFAKTKLMPDNRVWMAENMNYDSASARCGQGNCDVYGRLYLRDKAMSICPTGWHLPSDSEWATLASAAGGANAGLNLKSKTGWPDGADGKYGNGTDIYGFTALPGSRYYNYGGSVYTSEAGGFWWTSDKQTTGKEYTTWRVMKSNADNVSWVTGDPFGNYCAVRCIKNN